jgi:hypothetical protein
MSKDGVTIAKALGAPIPAIATASGGSGSRPPKPTSNSSANSGPGTTVKVASAPVPPITAGLGANASIVFESYDVRRPDAADLSISTLRDEFYKLGYIATPSDVMSQLGNQAALPAMANPKLTAQGLLTELGGAHTQYASATEFGKLASVLSKAVTTALDNPALVVTDPTIRDSLQSALLDLALVNGKLARDPQHTADAKQLQRVSEDLMTEWIRTFSEAEITQTMHGPEAEKLYTRVRSECDRLGRGLLEVTVDDPNVQLYVNEEIRSLQRPITDLVPGRYRVLLMGPNDDARVFKVDVRPNQTSYLRVQWAVSSNLMVSTSSVGFVFASPTHPEAPMLACKLASATNRGNDAVVLLSMEASGKQWRVLASLYETRQCRLLREGFVVSAQLTAKLANALARFIAQGIRDPDVIVVAEANPSVFQKMINERIAEAAALAKPAPAEPEPVRWVGWTVLGGSMAMFAAGGYALHSDHGPIGAGAISLGVALGAIAIYSWSRETSPEASHVTIAPLRAGAAIGWAGSF